jgi:hypothetical protein
VSHSGLGHRQQGEQRRLALLSRLLDPMRRRLLAGLGVRAGARTLEVGRGNGSLSPWLADRVTQTIAFTAACGRLPRGLTMVMDRPAAGSDRS